MKIAKYTLYVEINDYDTITTKELQEEIERRVLNQCALNGKCLLVEEVSRVVDTSKWSDERYDHHPLNFQDNIERPEVWEQELKEDCYEKGREDNT